MARVTATPPPGAPVDAGSGPPPVVIPADEQGVLLDLARTAIAVATGAQPASALTFAVETVPCPTGGPPPS